MGNSATSVANPLVQQANTATASMGTTTPATNTTSVTGATSTGANTATSTTPSSAQNWYNPDAIHAQMAKNGAAYAATTDPTARAALHQQNLHLAAMLGGTFNPNTGAYTYSGQGLSTPLPAAYQTGTAPAAWQGVDGNVKAGEGTDTISNNGNQINATIYQGTSYATAADIAKMFGGSYKQDPTTGAITINGQTVQPTGYDKNGNPIVSVKQALGAMGYDQNQINFDPKTRQVTVTGSPQQQSTYTDPLAGLGPMPGMPQLQPYQQPDLSAYYNNMVPYQTTFTPNWNSYYNQAQAQQDPLTQNSINTLMNKQGMDITKTDEGLNAKGIFNSGIAVQAENQIRANTNDQVAKVIMNANSQIAKIAQSLYQDAEKQWNDGNTMALKNNQMWLTQAMNQQKQSFQQWLSTQQLSLQQYNYAVNAWDKMAQVALSDASNQMKANQFQQTQALNYAKTFGYDQNGHPTLDTWKALGYMPGPNGKLVPTEQTSNDQRDYAIKLAQTMGYMTNPDGSITPTLQAQNDQATQSLDRDKLNAQIDQWAKTDQLDARKISDNETAMEEKRSYDQSMIDKAIAAQADTNKRTQLEGLKDQLDAAAKNIQTKQAQLQSGQTLSDSDSDILQYNNIMNQIQKIVNPDGSTNSSSSSNSSDSSMNNGYGNNPFTGN